MGKNNLALMMAVILCAAAAHAEDAPEVAWGTQTSEGREDAYRDVDTDAAGNVYVSGYRSGGQSFVRKLDADGNEAWSTSAGSDAMDVNSAVAADAAGNTVSVGFTEGNFARPVSGTRDAYLSKLDTNGNELWRAQFGSSRVDYASAVAMDAAGNIYVSGCTSGAVGETHYGNWDAFVTKFDSAGNQLWVNQVGTAQADLCYGLALDGDGNSYIAGFTSGDLGGQNAGGTDMFVSKFDAPGNLIWTKQFGSSQDDEGRDVTVDAWGNVYVVGHVGYVNAMDMQVTRLDADGNTVWTYQQGGPGSDNTMAVDTDKNGNVYVASRTWGDEGAPSAGISDALLTKLSPVGTPVWHAQMGSADAEWAGGLTIDGFNAYVVGTTKGDLYGTHPGDGRTDGFLTKYENIPEPATLSLLALGGLAVLRRRKSW